MANSVPPQAPEPAAEAQSAAAVLMIRPANFGFNPQTAGSNAFQHRPEGASHGPSDHGASEIQRLALQEFDRLADALERTGVAVMVADDTQEPVKPDAIFPNNWVSFHADGTVVLYPMLALNRRAERREELIGEMVAAAGFRTARTVDLSHRENRGQYLEGTGSLVLDRVRHIAYANISARTDLDALGDFAQQLDYDLVTFESVDGAGRSIYHTNVMMSVGTGFAVVCAESITDPSRREAVHSTLESGRREIVDITFAQMQAFAGNLLELAPAGSNAIALSTTAWRSLDPAQRRALERHGRIVAADIPVIERYGGGGVRCMLAEIHLPRRV
ncbi:MAG: arginine deiminase-related protein [Steroidobacteraceae bacterium]|jgi:hypothetical protein